MEITGTITIFETVTVGERDTIAILTLAVLTASLLVALSAYIKKCIKERSANITTSAVRVNQRVSRLRISNAGHSDARNIRIESKTKGAEIFFDNRENPYTLLCSGDSYEIQIICTEHGKTVHLSVTWDDNHKNGRVRARSVFL